MTTLLQGNSGHCTEKDFDENLTRVNATMDMYDLGHLHFQDHIQYNYF